MEQPKFKKIQDGAYFIMDPSGFQVSVTQYDPVLANQTILSGWGNYQLEDPVPLSVEVEEEHSEATVQETHQQTDIS